MNAKQIKIKDKSKLYIKWDDELETEISLKYLRDECPCANCKGETVLLKTYRPVKQNIDNPDMYKITNIETVGGYAIAITWKDGHNTGIYSWEYLKKLEDSEKSGGTQNYTSIL